MLSTPDIKSITAKAVIHNNTPLNISLSLFIILFNLLFSFYALHINKIMGNITPNMSNAISIHPDSSLVNWCSRHLPLVSLS
jgi:hypothetical protein